MAESGEKLDLVKVIMTSQPSKVNVMRGIESSEAHDVIITVDFEHAGDLVATVSERSTAIWDIKQSALIAVIDLKSRRATSVSGAPTWSVLVFGTEKGPFLYQEVDCLLNSNSKCHWGIVVDLVQSDLSTPLTEAPKTYFPSAPTMG